LQSVNPAQKYSAKYDVLLFSETRCIFDCSVQTVLRFYIAILDINDNAPVFVNAPYVVNISEVCLNHMTCNLPSVTIFNRFYPDLSAIKLYKNKI